MNSLSQVDDDPTSGDAPLFREYRAPRQHGEAFLDPPLAEASSLLAGNRVLLSEHADSWKALRLRARQQLVDDAIRYTSAYRDVDWAGYTSATPIIMAGHQPTICHPGVWFKNFVLSRLGQSLNAIPINMVVDNDVASGSSIRVPTLDRESGAAIYRTVRYDLAGGGVPFEQSEISDRELFDRFDQSVMDLVWPLVPNPGVERLWQHARAAIDRCGFAGCALAQARHGLEADIGLKTLELPVSVICRSESFAEFVVAILSDLPRFHHCYNESADLYRQAHGIRSSAHPVPNLSQNDEWLEAPLWIYGNQSPTRRAAWVKTASDHLLISDRESREIRIEIGYPKIAAHQLSEQMGPEFKVRPRALLTTMYARTVLSDLFLHGIGGAKYDQLGDMITQGFFGITPPEFMVISATIHLPGLNHSNHTEKIASLKRGLRDTMYQPERFSDVTNQDDPLLRRKTELLASIPPRGQRLDWHRQITSINRQLAQRLDSQREQYASQLETTQKAAASQAILENREHPFCIYPLDYLRESFEQLVSG